jgi:hypothetical protein
MPFRDRAPIDPVTLAYPGFYRVPPGSLVEPGDQMLDTAGRPTPCALEQVGRAVTPEWIVLRADRRRPYGDEARPPPRPRGVPGP